MNINLCGTWVPVPCIRSQFMQFPSSPRQVRQPKVTKSMRGDVWLISLCRPFPHGFTPAPERERSSVITVRGGTEHRLTSLPVVAAENGLPVPASRRRCSRLFFPVCFSSSLRECGSGGESDQCPQASEPSLRCAGARHNKPDASISRSRRDAAETCFRNLSHCPSSGITGRRVMQEIRPRPV